MASKPTMRATSSMRSASMAMSKRYEGGVTSQPSALGVVCISRPSSVRCTRSAGSDAPRRRASCFRRSVTGGRFGRCAAVSVTSMGPAVPPAMGASSAIARSIARPCSAKSTPRSKRWLASEEHTSELQSRQYLVCRLLLEKKKKNRWHHAKLHYLNSSLDTDNHDDNVTSVLLNKKQDSGQTLVQRSTHTVESMKAMKCG